jgi:isopenicillin-N epimerase
MNELARHWTLDPDVTFLNHGSFGACPRPVLDYQRELRARMEREPVQFFLRALEPLQDAVRAEIADFAGARPGDIAFVPNATTGVNTVLRSLPFVPGDEILATNHVYLACKLTADFVAERTGARVVVADVPAPVREPGEIVERVLAGVTPRTRLAMVDHITSPTATVLPVEAIVRELQARGVDTLVDGAHAPGHVRLRLDALGAAYYTGNCHKWLCAPKGAAILHVRRDRQAGIHPLTISHGYGSTRTDRSPFRLEFDYCGTNDPTAALSIGECVRFLSALRPGGWEGLARANHALVLRGRDLLCERHGLTPLAPEQMTGFMVSLGLPDSGATSSIIDGDPLQRALWDRYRIEVPVFTWPGTPRRVLRISAQAYNSIEDYERLSDALAETGLTA